MTARTVLARSESGAILGIDARRSGLSDVTVPGHVPADAVEVGDTVTLSGGAVVVSKHKHGQPGRVYLGVRTAGGAVVHHELRTSEPIHVTAVGAFDR